MLASDAVAPASLVNVELLLPAMVGDALLVLLAHIAVIAGMLKFRTGVFQLTVRVDVMLVQFVLVDGVVELVDAGLPLVVLVKVELLLVVLVDGGLVNVELVEVDVKLV